MTTFSVKPAAALALGISTEMRPNSRLPCSATTSDYARFLDSVVGPTHYMVSQLKHRHGDTWIGRTSGVDDAQTVYRDVAWRFTDRLSREIYGNRGYRNRRYRPIPHLITLEGDGLAIRYHLNVLPQCPEWMDGIQFAEKCEKVWWNCPWAYRSENSFKIEERTGNCPGYSLKDHLKKDADCILSFFPARDSLER